MTPLPYGIRACQAASDKTDGLLARSWHAAGIATLMFVIAATLSVFVQVTTRV
jgi:hypothetical protein